MKRFLLPLLGAIATACAAVAAPLSVTVSHDLDQPRPAETIAVPWADVTQAFPEVLALHLEVKDAAGRMLPYQVVRDARGGDELIFQHDFAAGEKRAVFTIDRIDGVAPVFPAKVFARYVPERLDDFAWENDKIAHRTYGPALGAAAPHGSDKEVLISSGLDVWGKRVSYPIIDRWYNQGEYHTDSGEGMDFFQVGTSRGCGGTGVWDGHELHVSRNFSGWKVLANGPIRAVFELRYDTWTAGNVVVSEVKRFTVDAGHAFDQVESTFTISGAREITVGIGLGKQPATPDQKAKIEVARDENDGALSQWIDEKLNGSIGTAVVVPENFAGYAEDERNVLALARVTAGQPLRYRVGATWARTGEIGDAAAWSRAIAAEAARARSPLHVTVAVPPVATGETARTPDGVRALMERVADWQLAHPKENPRGWENGAFYTGVMALAGIADDPRFDQAMLAMGERLDWQLGKRVYHADDHCVGQTYAELYLEHRDPRMIAPLQARFDEILAHPRDNNLDFDAKKNPHAGDRWSWCDTLFMAPPAWVRLWKATGDRRYLDFAVDKWWVTSDFLYDRDEHLYFRDSTIFPKREKNGRKVFWSRGNGWVMAGLARVLEFLPPDHPQRGRFETQFREMAASILKCQQPDGLWRSSLLDPENYPRQETSGSSFYCFAFAWGVNHGLLPREPYAGAATKAWDALSALVNRDGKLTHVQPVGYTPVHFDEQNNEQFGAGAFLLAGSEIYRLLGK